METELGKGEGNWKKRKVERILTNIKGVGIGLITPLVCKLIKGIIKKYKK